MVLLLFFLFLFLFSFSLWYFSTHRSLVKGICSVFVLAIFARKLNLAAFLWFFGIFGFRLSFLGFLGFLASLLARDFCIFGWLIDICLLPGLFPNLVPIRSPFDLVPMPSCSGQRRHSSHVKISSQASVACHPVSSTPTAVLLLSPSPSVSHPLLDCFMSHP